MTERRVAVAISNRLSGTPEIVIRLVGTFLFAGRSGLWEIPIMENITTLDSRRRGIFPSPFQPGDSVVKEYQDSERITFRLVKPADVPEVKTRRKRGFTLLQAPEVPQAEIARALRADRDSR